MHHPFAICISAISTLAPLAIWRGFLPPLFGGWRGCGLEGEAVFAGGAMQLH